MKRWACFAATGLLLLTTPAAAYAQESEAPAREMTEAEQRVFDFLSVQDEFDFSMVGVAAELDVNIVAIKDEPTETISILPVEIYVTSGSTLNKDQNTGAISGHINGRIDLYEKHVDDFVFDFYKEKCPENENQADFYARINDGDWLFMEGAEVITSADTYQFFDMVLDSEDFAEYFRELLDYEIFESPDQTGAVLHSTRSLLDYKNYIDKYTDIITELTPEEEAMLEPYLDAFKITTLYYLSYEYNVQDGCGMTIFKSDLNKINELSHMLSNLYYENSDSEIRYYLDLNNVWLNVGFIEDYSPVTAPDGIDKSVEPNGTELYTVFHTVIDAIEELGK